jgi:hypothetical protein
MMRDTPVILWHFAEHRPPAASAHCRGVAPGALQTQQVNLPSPRSSIRCVSVQ